MVDEDGAGEELHADQPAFVVGPDTSAGRPRSAVVVNPAKIIDLAALRETVNQASGA